MRVMGWASASLTDIPPVGTAIDAMQLEFGAHLRTRNQLERTAADVARAIVVFAGEYLPLKSRSNNGSE